MKKREQPQDPIPGYASPSESSQNFRIRDMDSEEQPRERLERLGPEMLSNAELFAILLRTGKPGLNVLDAAKKILRRHGNSIRAVSRLSLEDWAKEEAVGKIKAISIAAVFELAKRYMLEETEPGTPVTSPAHVFDRYWPRVRDLTRESFFVIMLNSRNMILGDEVVSEGTVDATLIHPRECFQKPIALSAVSVILMHNHPSENPSPSQDDIEITRTLIDAGETLRIRVLDHIIIAGNQYHSFKEGGTLKF